MNLNFKDILKKRGSAGPKDVVALEIGADLAQGIPVVRLDIAKKQTRLLAAGFVKFDDRLPTTPEEAAKSDVYWSLPKQFQASKAAIAVTSPFAILRQTSDVGEADKSSAKMRKVSAVTDRQHPPLIATMPDFMAAWIAARFPQGRRPTTRSIQTSMSAAINCFCSGPVPQSSDNPAIVVFCFKSYSAIAAFFENRLILYREHPIGYQNIRYAICREMRIDSEMAETLLNDPVVDLSAALTPVLTPLFRQVDISADYVSRRKNCEINHFHIYGISSGIKYWSNMFVKVVGKPLNHLHPFGGILCNRKKLSLPESFDKDAPLFTSAIGAARALLEDL